MKLIISPSFLFGSFLFQDRVPTNQKEKKSQITNKEKQKCQKKKKKYKNDILILMHISALLL